MIMNESDKNFIAEAAQFFLDPGPVAKSLNWIGKPIEALTHRLPEKAQKIISLAAKKAIEKALVAAVRSLPDSSASSHKPSQPIDEKASHLSGWIHKASTTLTGGVSGFVGLPALPIELPVTTVLILRGILDQARLFGHDIQDMEIRMECLMIFSLGTNTPSEDSMESAYFLARTAHAQAVRQAAQYLSKLSSQELAEALQRGSAPALVRLVAQIARAFEIRVSQKAIAGVVPFMGALTGGALNFAFTDFYSKAARYHFGVRSLEKKYGTEMVHDLMKQAQ